MLVYGWNCFLCTSKTAWSTHTGVLISVKDGFVCGLAGLFFVLGWFLYLKLEESCSWVFGNRSGGSDASLWAFPWSMACTSIPLSTLWFDPDGHALQLGQVIPQNTGSRFLSQPKSRLHGWEPEHLQGLVEVKAWEVICSPKKGHLE